MPIFLHWIQIHIQLIDSVHAAIHSWFDDFFIDVRHELFFEIVEVLFVRLQHLSDFV